MTALLRTCLALALAAIATLAFANAPTTRTPAGPPPVEGVDYVRIDGGAPYAQVPGTVEVAEVFGYACPHCAHFEPALRAWARTLPKGVRVVPVPAPWDPYARAFVAARTLKVADASHGAVFKALHEDGSLPLRDPQPGEIAQFYARYNVPPARFTAAMAAPAVDAELQRAAAFFERSGVEGTPTLVINGRYRVTARGRAEVFRVAEHLIARERRTR